MMIITLWMRAGKNSIAISKRPQAGPSLSLNFQSFKKCVFELFDEYGHRQNKITLSGDMKEWSWFKIYLFSKDKIDLVEELNFSNFLLAHHGLFDYEEFSACIDNSVLSEKPLAFCQERRK